MPGKRKRLALEITEPPSIQSVRRTSTLRDYEALLAASRQRGFKGAANLPPSTVRRLRAAVYHHAYPENTPFLHPQEVSDITAILKTRFREKPRGIRGIHPTTVKKHLAKVRRRFGERQVSLTELRANGLRTTAQLFSLVLRGKRTGNLPREVVSEVRRRARGTLDYGQRELKTPQQLLAIATGLHQVLFGPNAEQFLVDRDFRNSGHRKFMRQIRQLVLRKENALPEDRKAIEAIEEMVYFPEMPEHRARRYVRDVESVYKAVNKDTEPGKERRITRKDLKARLGGRYLASYGALLRAFGKGKGAHPFSDDQLGVLEKMLRLPGRQPETWPAVHVTRINLIYAHFGRKTRLGRRHMVEGAEALGIRGITRTRELAVAVLRGEKHPFTRRQAEIIRAKVALGRRG